ncbi:MAG: SDR family oxidoreductase [Rubrivivax sp.]
MDLGIRGRLALVCGASRGLGFACADRLAEAGAQIVLVARDAAKVEAAAATLHARHGVPVRALAADSTSDAGCAAILRECPAPDILVLSGGWPTAAQRSGDADASAVHAALQSMLLAQMALVARVAPGMAARGFGRVVAITSRLIKNPEWELALPSVARLGLSAYLKAASRNAAWARRNVTFNSLLPGVFASETQVAQTERLAREQHATIAAVEAERLALTPAGRWGVPDEFGACCAFLCSAHAGFINGQALAVDGGAHGGLW